MGYKFKIIAEGDYACFSRPELKVERVSYDVPTPGALEGMLKSIFWKPAIRYCIDKIIVFNPIDFINIRRNEVKDKVLLKDIEAQMKGVKKDACIYASESRSQRASMILKNVKYGIEFHFEMTGLRSDNEHENEEKYYSIIKRRLEKGQHFRTPCFGCSEFPVRSITLVDKFDMNLVSSSVLAMGDHDLGFMCYKLFFDDKGIPVNGDWDNPKFSDSASAKYYHPHLVNGVIDVAEYGRELKC